MAEVRRLRDAVKRADPGRLVMVSTQGGESESLSLAMEAELDVIAFHELQKSGWHRRVHCPGLEGGKRATKTRKHEILIRFATSLRTAFSRFRAFVAPFLVASWFYSENSFASSTHSPCGASC